MIKLDEQVQAILNDIDYGDAITEQAMYEMTNLGHRETNLPIVVFISPRMSSHGPRIKFQNGYNTNWRNDKSVSMSISDNPEILTKCKLKIKSKDLEQLKNWVVINKDVLLAFWNDEISISQVLSRLKEVTDD